MSTISEIKSKYSLDGAVSVTVDLESMREGAKNTLNESVSLVKDMEAEGAIVSEKSWLKRRATRIADDVKEQKRKVALAQKYIDEINGILDKASENIAKVK